MVEPIEKENSGFLFRNDRKSQESHSDFSGRVNIDGVQYWINAWVNEKNGKKYFGLRFKPLVVQEKPVNGHASVDIDDEIPF